MLGTIFLKTNQVGYMVSITPAIFIFPGNNFSMGQLGPHVNFFFFLNSALKWHWTHEQILSPEAPTLVMLARKNYLEFNQDSKAIKSKY